MTTWQIKLHSHIVVWKPCNPSSSTFCHSAPPCVLQELFNARAALLRLQRLTLQCDALAGDSEVQHAVDAVLQVHAHQ